MSESLYQDIRTEVLSFLDTKPTPEQILAYHLPAALEQPATAFAARMRDTDVTYDERIEMAGVKAVLDLLTFLKTQARRTLEPSESR